MTGRLSVQVRHTGPPQALQQMLTVVCVQVRCGYFKMPSQVVWQARVDLPEQSLGFVDPSYLPKGRKERSDCDEGATCANSELPIMQGLLVILLKIVG